MILYHFTDLYRLDSIKKHGIYKGDVPISIMGGYNAPWLTTDPNPSNQKWGNKTGLKLTINIPDNDPNLNKWTDITKQEIEKAKTNEDKEMLAKWYKALHDTGGESNNWYVYHGTIPFKWVTKIGKEE